MKPETLEPWDLTFQPQQLDWQRKARCADIPDPDLFFPERGSSTKYAMALCKRCPVKQECLDYAVQNKIEDGIWGGMGLRARRSYAIQLRRQQKPEKAVVFVSPQKVEKSLKLVRMMYVPRRGAVA